MTPKDHVLHRELSKEIVGAFYQVHYELGFGFLESVYSAAMACALMESGLTIEREVPVAVHFRGLRIGTFRADAIVEHKILLELKASPVVHPATQAQIINYLRATDLELGILLHFGEKPRFKRFVYSNDRKLLSCGFA